MSDDPIRDSLYDRPEGRVAHARNRQWLFNGLAIAIILIAAVNARSLERWAAAKPPSWGVETVRLTTGVWADRMEVARLNEPRAWIAEQWAGLRRTAWDELENPIAASDPVTEIPDDHAGEQSPLPQDPGQP